MARAAHGMNRGIVVFQKLVAFQKTNVGAETVTEIDHAHLFYLMARGVEEKLARGLLVKAFLREVIEELDDEAIVEALESRLEDWFENHG